MTWRWISAAVRTRFQLTRPLRGVTTFIARVELRNDISTHTPLAGRDLIPKEDKATIKISTHTPLAGRDQIWTSSSSTWASFQLTRPLRGVTGGFLSVSAEGLISTHTPLAGRDVEVDLRSSADEISTHTPLAGRDHVHRPGRTPKRYFNSHAPCGA